ncbi:Deoxycytidine triphosphate deaminase protein [Marine Group I thaumarchaeote SCGC AAA799-E16]|uniref:Deoxycytidine triphosphate deaminase protein n=1 Tax=Marine Group I thaumarchaeote SCGC AAA799-E16 TaxID=1502292 RepID=A0A081S7M2_9ARCH|nr:Deoxycytidine triphosphate deaminase protein [Marine Group I thaumarchaeote SCGC AAA799-E16]
MNTKNSIAIAVIVSVIATFGVTMSFVPLYTETEFESPDPVEILGNTPEPEIIYVDKSISKFFEGTNDIKKIPSQEELVSILEATSSFSGGFYDPRVRSMAVEEAAMFDSAESVATSAPQPGFKGDDGGVDYSTTNVQVENVDEPDYLKNDGKYVYIVSRNTLNN